MTNERIPAIEAGPGKEIRFEIERTPRVSRVSMRVWTSLSGQSEKVPTGRAVTVDAAHFPEFREAVLRAGKALAPSADVHE